MPIPVQRRAIATITACTLLIALVVLLLSRLGPESPAAGAGPTASQSTRTKQKTTRLRQPDESALAGATRSAERRQILHDRAPAHRVVIVRDAADGSPVGGACVHVYLRKQTLATGRTDRQGRWTWHRNTSTSRPHAEDARFLAMQRGYFAADTPVGTTPETAATITLHRSFRIRGWIQGLPRDAASSLDLAAGIAPFRLEQPLADYYRSHDAAFRSIYRTYAGVTGDYFEVRTPFLHESRLSVTVHSRKTNQSLAYKSVAISEADLLHDLDVTVVFAPGEVPARFADLRVRLELHGGLAGRFSMTLMGPQRGSWPVRSSLFGAFMRGDSRSPGQCSKLFSGLPLGTYIPVITVYAVGTYRLPDLQHDGSRQAVTLTAQPARVRFRLRAPGKATLHLSDETWFAGLVPRTIEASHASEVLLVAGSYWAYAENRTAGLISPPYRFEAGPQPRTVEMDLLPRCVLVFRFDPDVLRSEHVKAAFVRIRDLGRGIGWPRMRFRGPTSRWAVPAGRYEIAVELGHRRLVKAFVVRSGEIPVSVP